MNPWLLLIAAFAAANRGRSGPVVIVPTGAAGTSSPTGSTSPVVAPQKKKKTETDGWCVAGQAAKGGSAGATAGTAASPGKGTIIGFAVGAIGGAIYGYASGECDK